jgi:hypothetical protein
MIARRGTVLAGMAAAPVAAAVLLACDGSDPLRTVASVAQSKDVVVGCARRSEGDFPGAFTDSANLTVGPLALMGAAHTDARTVREYGGNKFPLLVKAGRTVTVRLAREVRRSAGLIYGGLGKRPLRDGPHRLRDAADAMKFVACRPGRPSERYRPEGPSESRADGKQVTFWSGFVLTRTPACLPLEIYIDDNPTPRRVGLPLGRRCRAMARRGA